MIIRRVRAMRGAKLLVGKSVGGLIARVTGPHGGCVTFHNAYPVVRRTLRRKIKFGLAMARWLPEQYWLQVCLRDDQECYTLHSPSAEEAKAHLARRRRIAPRDIRPLEYFPGEIPGRAQSITWSVQ